MCDSIEGARRRYAEELRYTARLGSQAVIVAFATVPRERLTLIRIFEEIRALGYEGSYDAVRRYAKGWRAKRGAAMAEAYVPLSFAPGEATSSTGRTRSC